MSDEALPEPSDSCPRCAALLSAERRRGGVALTDERRRIFLETLAKTDSPTAASAAATPWAAAGTCGTSTFYDEQKRNAEFAAAWRAAEEQALATVESELMRRALEPTTRPVCNGGSSSARNSSTTTSSSFASRPG